MTTVRDTPNSQPNTPAPISIRSTIALVCLAQFIMVLDVSIVNVALPAMQSELRLDPQGLQWVVNAYLLTFAGFLLLGGRAADLYGRRRVFVAGLTAFAAASLIGGLAITPGTLIAARALQGLGAAIVSPATLTILITSIPDGPQRARAIATWAAVGAVGGAAGSLIGGVLTDHLSWRAILLINVPIGAVAIVAALRLLTETRDLRARRLDLIGAITVTFGLLALEFGVLNGSGHGWGSPHALLPVTAGVLALAVFVLVQARFARVPLMPLSALQSRSMSGALLMQLLLGAAGFAVWYFLSLYMQQELHLSALQAGLAFLPHTLAIIVASKATPQLVTRIGTRPLLITGALVSATGFGWQATVTPENDLITGIILPGILITGGMGLCSAPITMTATAGASPDDAGMLSGILNVSRQVGGSLGLAALTALAAGASGRQSSEYALEFWVCGALATSSAVAAAVLPKAPRSEPKMPKGATAPPAAGAIEPRDCLREGAV
ncbi:MFS transporter [Glycomyces terrestris]|uniref:DHA2 family efflux MFS transporter permease subunit n=1 Tax=Glycomyces terrestris TaxID=2493553 RepID=A0A426UX42_9ACTN|nr:MFS transporter [Glycomyces terrestris]RRR99203.1 DHA2 family efflux MFS transporter permease subunit [Glycomyces terrestris]